MLKIMKQLIPSLITTWVVMLFLLFSIQISYGFFDKLLNNKPESILIGNWISLNDPASAENISTLIDDLYADDLLIIEYFNSIFFKTDAQNNVILDDVFYGYTVDDMIEAMAIIAEYIDSFLYYNNGVLTYPTTPGAPIPILIDDEISSGESVMIKYFILAANLADTVPINFSITMSAPAGVNISDFAVEVLMDQRPFTIASPYDYRYLHTGMTKNNWLNRNKVSLVPITAPVSFSTEVRRTTTIFYNHYYQPPVLVGDWGRFPTGPSMFLTESTNAFTVSNNTYTAGIYLRGRFNGALSKLDIEIGLRSPKINPKVEIMPIILIVSRGVSSNGSIINPDNIMPTIEINIFRG